MASKVVIATGASSGLVGLASAQQRLLSPSLLASITWDRIPFIIVYLTSEPSVSPPPRCQHP